MGIIRLLALVLFVLLGFADLTVESLRLNDSTLPVHREAFGTSVGKQETQQHLRRTDMSRIMRSTWTVMRPADNHIVNSKLKGSVQVPLFAGSSYDYFVAVHIGSPPRKLRLILDTGSDLLWTQCAPCANCFTQLSPIFEPGKSASYSPVPCTSTHLCSKIPKPLHRQACSASSPEPCRYRYAYVDGSSSQGALSTETVTLKAVAGGGRDVEFHGVTFGCGDSNSVGFEGADGVLGLGQGPLSFSRQIAQGYGAEFAYCMMDLGTRAASVLVFGEDSAARVLERTASAEALQYTAIVDNPASRTSYFVRIASVRVDGEVLPIDPALFGFNYDGTGGTIFDSGTVLTYLLPRVYKAVLSALEKVVYAHYTIVEDDWEPGMPGLKLGLCFLADGPVRELKHLPALEVVFAEGSVFAPHSSNLFVDMGDGVKCLAVAKAEEDSTSFNTLGNIFQQHFVMVHDSARRRIGFAKADCSPPNRRRSFPFPRGVGIARHFTTTTFVNLINKFR